MHANMPPALIAEGLARMLVRLCSNRELLVKRFSKSNGFSFRLLSYHRSWKAKHTIDLKSNNFLQYIEK